MKIRKTLSILCAIAMLASALPAASAVEVDSLSQHAGQTISVQVVEAGEDGLTSNIVEVAIPEGATDEEANALILAASCPSPYSTNASTYRLSYIKGMVFTDEERKAGGGILPEGQITNVSAIFNLNRYEPSDAKLLVQYVNNTLGTVNNRWNTIDLVDGINTVVFYSHEYIFRAGHEISIYAKSSSSTGYIYTWDCTVNATLY